MIVATAGHVDHGKTTLVRAFTGVETDRLTEEKRRGLTIDLGFAYTEWQGERWGFVDVPGHHRFIGNMLAGVAAIDLALLVVAADEGPMPQTREHLQILDLLGVNAGVVAMTRSDLADDTTLARHEEATRELLTATSLDGAPIVAVSARTGDGLETLKQALLARRPRTRPRIGTGFRLAIDRAFTVTGAGTIVTGCAHAGRVAIGDELVLVPGGARVRVRDLRAQDTARKEGLAGERLALNLTGIHPDQIHRGQWLVTPELARPVTRFDARLTVLPGYILRSGLEVHIHHGAAHTMGRITVLDGPAEGPRVHIAARQSLGVLHGDRFVLRDASGMQTLAGGRVLDPSPPRRGRRSPARLAELDAYEGESPAVIVPALLRRSPLELDLEELAWKLAGTPEELATTVPGARTETLGGYRLRDAAAWTELQDRLCALLDAFHAEAPQLAGMGIDTIRRRLEPAPEPGILRAALRDAIRSGRLARTATTFHLPDHRPRLTPEDSRDWAGLRPHLARTPRQPPVVHDLARELERDPDSLAALLECVAQTGALVRVARNRFLLPDAVTELAALTADLDTAAAGDGFDARSFRDAAGIGRNLTIDLLEFFDRAGLTRRTGDRRWLIADPAEIFPPPDPP